MGMGFGDWGLGIGLNPQSPIPNPQSPIPIFYFFLKYLYHNNIFINLKMITFKKSNKKWKTRIKI
jgi:hypothetical protein